MALIMSCLERYIHESNLASTLGIKGGVLLVILTTLLVIRYQHNQINRLSEQNSQLEYQQSTLQSQLMQWHEQAENL